MPIVTLTETDLELWQGCTEYVEDEDGHTDCTQCGGTKIVPTPFGEAVIDLVRGIEERSRRIEAVRSRLFNQREQEKADTRTKQLAAMKLKKRRHR